MYKILIFGGTTEGRELAEFCENRGISALSSVATMMGAKRLPERAHVTAGRLDINGMAALMKEDLSMVIDATHPYAVEASRNIKEACEISKIRYFRVIREEKDPGYGESVSDIGELVKRLNELSGAVLSTLGSKEAAALTGVLDFKNRVWLRILPNLENIEMCVSLGFDRGKIIAEKPPFSLEENIGHIKKSGAEILVTKNSGISGGYPEKTAAARESNIKLITINRPREDGVSLNEIKALIDKENSNGE